MSLKRLEQRLEKYVGKLEKDAEYEMSEEMQDEYYEIQRQLDEAKSEPELWGSRKLDSLQRKFKRVTSQFENPDDITKSTLKMMYPESDGDFDLDEWGDD